MQPASQFQKKGELPLRSVIIVIILTSHAINAVSLLTISNFVRVKNLQSIGFQVAFCDNFPNSMERLLLLYHPTYLEKNTF